MKSPRNQTQKLRQGDRPRHPAAHYSTLGFTLVEMLTVVAVIGVLLSLLLGAVALAKRKAESTACLSNLHQMGIALGSFVADHRAYPFFIRPDPSWRAKGFGTMWASSILPDQIGDLKDGKGVFRCLSASRPKNWPKQSGYGFYGYNADGLTGTDHLGNLGLGGTGEPGGGIKPVPESAVAQPSRMLAIGDAVIEWKGVVHDGLSKIGRIADAGTVSGIPTSGAARRVARRHNGKLNELFCDAHAEPVALETLYEQTDSASLALWNRDGKPHAERLK